MMLAPRQIACGLLVLVATLLGFCGCARGLVPAVGVQPGRPVQAALGLGQLVGGKACGGEGSLVGEVVNGITNGVSHAAGCAGEAVAGSAAGAVGNGILNVVAEWVIGAATQVTGFVAAEMTKTTTPQLQSAWFEAQFQPMADLGVALGLLVALIALACAAVRRSPEALAGALAGIARAGIGTGLVVALTAIGLGIADQVSSAVLASSPHTFWATAAHAWGKGGFGGFGSSALATLIALVEVFAALFVWLELIVRDAAIYIAVLFFPVVLAASIWPALGSWPGRLGRLLLLTVVLKPVAVIVLSLAGSAAAAGLSFGSGVSGSVGTILAAVVIFGLAAFAPWALMYLLAADAESAYMASGLRTAAETAVADEHGRSVRSAGGLRNLGGDGEAPADWEAARPAAPGAAAVAARMVTQVVQATPWQVAGSRRVARALRTVRVRAADCRTGRCRSPRRRSAPGASGRRPVSAWPQVSARCPYLRVQATYASRGRAHRRRKRLRSSTLSAPTWKALAWSPQVALPRAGSRAELARCHKLPAEPQRTSLPYVRPGAPPAPLLKVRRSPPLSPVSAHSNHRAARRSRTAGIRRRACNARPRGAAGRAQRRSPSFIRGQTRT